MEAALLPAAFRREIISMLGAEADDFFASYNRPEYKALRLNPRVLDKSSEPRWAIDADNSTEAARRLADRFLDAPVPWQDGAFYITPDEAPGVSLMHVLGLYYIQEPSAMAAAAALGVRPGMKALDLCAAPGGKSSQIAAALRGTGLLIANEPVPQRAKMLASNIERQGFTNVIVTNEYPDALAKRMEGEFDAILVDAPCSGEGMFRRDAGALQQWNEGAPQMCHARQLDILHSAWRMLKSGGSMVYSTCTFNRTENEETINAFLSAHPDMSAQPFELTELPAAQDGMLRLWPHIIRGEGHFICALKKNGTQADDPLRVNKKAKRRSPTDKAAMDALKRLGECIALPQLYGNVITFGNSLRLLPVGSPELSGLKVAYAGLELAKIGRSHVEPAYALCRTLAPMADDVELSADDAVRLIAGEQLDCDGEGWLTASYKGLPICWCKAHDGRLNGHYPKGLRQTHIEP